MQHVLVAGGGPVGFLTALGLAQRGLRVTLVEAEPDIVDSPRAAVYHWYVLEGLKQLGILDEALEIGFAKQDYCHWVFRTNERIHWSLAPLAEVAPYPFNLHLGQNDLARIACRHLERFASAEVRFATRLTDVTQDASGVTARLSGPAGETVERFDWLIGADGGGSTVREKALKLNFFGITHPERFIATNVRHDFRQHGFLLSNLTMDPVYGAIIVPRDFSFVAEGAGPPAQVQVWSANPADSGLQSFVAATLTEEARRRYLMALGLDALTLENMNAMAVSVAPYAATRGGGVAAVSLADRLSGLLPMGLSFLLWISILIVGNRLLTGVIEERASKVMEVLLSSATPGEILSGKLIGIGMVGLSIIFVWLVSLIGATFVAEGELAEFGRRIISEFFSSGLIFFFLFYFTLGFAMQASLFLGVGAISNTLNDAQSYLTPLMIILVAPFAVLVEVQRDPSGMLAQVMSWIPFSTPVVMMVRAHAGAAWWEILGTGIVLIISTIFVIWLMARLFRAAMLRTGQPPRLAELGRLIWRGSASG